MENATDSSKPKQNANSTSSAGGDEPAVNIRRGYAADRANINSTSMAPVSALAPHVKATECGEKKFRPTAHFPTKVKAPLLHAHGGRAKEVRTPHLAA